MFKSYLLPFLYLLCVLIASACQPADAVQSKSSALVTPSWTSARSHDGKTVQVRERGLLVDEFTAADLSPPGAFAPDTWYNVSYPRRLSASQPRAGAAHVCDFRTDSNGEVVPFDASGGRYLLADGISLGDLGGVTDGSLDLSGAVPASASSVYVRTHSRPGPWASISFLPAPRTSATRVLSGEFVTVGSEASTERFWVPVGDAKSLHYAATGDAWTLTVSVVGYAE